MEKLAAGAGFAPTWPPSKGGVLLIRRPGNEMVEPEVVATSPNRIKSPVPVYGGFSSRKVVLAAGFARKWSQSPVLPWTERAYETCLSAGSAAFELRKWSPHPELHQAGLLTEQIHR